jgi:hypothetical protein
MSKRSEETEVAGRYREYLRELKVKIWKEKANYRQEYVSVIKGAMVFGIL